MAAFKNIFSTPVTQVAELIEHIPRALEEVLASRRYPRAHARGTQMISDPFSTLPFTPPVKGGETERNAFTHGFTPVVLSY
jgi:hypothetical protein